jgi:hypothetical protein
MFGKTRPVWILLLLTFFSLCAAAQRNSTENSLPESGPDGDAAEYQKRLQRLAENNQKIQIALNDGLAAFREKKYDLAIEKFDAAVALEPDYWGTAPVLLTNKAIVLRVAGVDRYNEAARKYWNAAEEAGPFFADAVASLNRALEIFSATPPDVADSNRESFDRYRLNALRELAECYRLLTITDRSKKDEAIKAFEEYIPFETDEAEKMKAQKHLEKLRGKN